MKSVFHGVIAEDLVGHGRGLHRIRSYDLDIL